METRSLHGAGSRLCGWRRLPLDSTYKFTTFHSNVHELAGFQFQTSRTWEISKVTEFHQYSISVPSVENTSLRTCSVVPSLLDTAAVFVHEKLGVLLHYRISQWTAAMCILPSQAFYAIVFCCGNCCPNLKCCTQSYTLLFLGKPQYYSQNICRQLSPFAMVDCEIRHLPIPRARDKTPLHMPVFVVETPSARRYVIPSIPAR